MRRAADSAFLDSVLQAPWIIERPDDSRLFEPLLEFEPGALRPTLLPAPVDPFEDLDTFSVLAPCEDAFDVIAWQRGTRSPWWTLRGLAVVIGERELAAAFWDDRHARMVATPADVVAANSTAFAIVDWSAEINAIITRAPGVECATPALERRLQKVLWQQAMPKLPITVASARVRAAA